MTKLGPLKYIQIAVTESKTAYQCGTGIDARALFLGTEVGEVQKEILKLRGAYGAQQEIDADERIAAELCDVIWNVCDLANMLCIDLDGPMKLLLETNKTRKWGEPRESEIANVEK